MAEALLERAGEVRGIDAAEKMIALGHARMARHPERSRLHLDVGTVEHLDFATGTFDAVVAMGVLEYVLDRPRALAQIHRVLRPGGAAILTVPSRISSYHLTRAAWSSVRRLAKRAMGRPPAQSERFVTKRCIPARLDRELARAGLAKAEGRFCNLILFTLHELHAGASLALNRRLSGLSDHALGAWLGTQYVVKAIRT
jgi:SAM-dependent methyltransferase